jgi:NAD(P)-dependent dehydrogenase (short-subunit alcohol dehydrogenase family)
MLLVGVCQRRSTFVALWLPTPTESATLLGRGVRHGAGAGRDADRNAQTVAEAMGEGLDLVPITADITDDADVDRMTGQAIDALGGLDI